ncbi:MAG TPA: glycosyltransferase [bacterium]|nr:glycosyltransferase [bacterium]
MLIIKNDKLKDKDYEDKPRVLIVGPASPSKGGIPSYIDDLLSSQLNDHFYLTILDPLALKQRCKKQESHLSLKEVVSALRVITIFIKTVRKYNPELLHIHTSSYWGFYEKAALLAIVKIIFNKKVILHIHGGEFDLFYKHSPWKKFICRILRWADKTLIVSKKFKEVIKEDCLICVDNSTCFSEDWKYVDKDKLVGKYGFNSNKILFLSLALLEKRKGIYETLQVFKSLAARRDDFLYIIAGEGPEKERLSEFIIENGLTDNIKMLDFVSGQNKKELLFMADAFILNSSNESFGVSLVEAVSHGLFVITTPVGIASDAENIFDDSNCIRVPIGNNLALEKAICNLLDKKINIAAIREMNYYNFKSRFDIEPVFEKMKKIYEEVLNMN